jgi:glutaredoxin
MKHRSISWIATATACLAATGALAQQYKVTGPDGRVTYTDRPPITQNTRVQPLTASGLPAPPQALPAALRDPATRYPVTLYTASDCSACDMGRSYLRQRGIPFAETTVNTPEDSAAFRQRFTTIGSLPLLTIGSQRMESFDQAAWSGYLDAAGYPKSSVLPTGYVASAATPMAPLAADPAKGGSNPTLPQAATAQRSDAPQGNAPAGFKF